MEFIISRRSFALIMLITLVCLWMPTQATTAQTECPEGGCKIYLPVVPVTQHLQITGVGIVGQRYCTSAELIVGIRNVGQERVAQFRLTGHVVFDDGSEGTYDRVVTEPLYPGASLAVRFYAEPCLTISNQMFQIADVVIDYRTILPLPVLSKTVDADLGCYGAGTVEVSGEIQNDTSYTLTNLVVQFGPYGVGSTEKLILQPGDITKYAGSFEVKLGLPDFCGQPFDVDVQAWDEYVPVAN